MLKGLNDSAPSQGSAEDLDAADAATPDYHFNSTGEVPGKISGSTPETFFRASSGTRSRVSENEDAQLIGLGMSEALPPFEIIEKLYVSTESHSSIYPLTIFTATIYFSPTHITWHQLCILVGT